MNWAKNNKKIALPKIYPKAYPQEWWKPLGLIPDPSHCSQNGNR